MWSHTVEVDLSKVDFDIRMPQPYCTCRGGSRSFRDAGDDLWVHVTCNKPTRMFLEAHEKEKKK